MGDNINVTINLEGNITDILGDEYDLVIRTDSRYETISINSNSINSNELSDTYFYQFLLKKISSNGGYISGDDLESVYFNAKITGDSVLMGLGFIVNNTELYDWRTNPNSFYFTLPELSQLNNDSIILSDEIGLIKKIDDLNYSYPDVDYYIVFNVNENEINDNDYEITITINYCPINYEVNLESDSSGTINTGLYELTEDDTIIMLGDKTYNISNLTDYLDNSDNKLKLVELE